MNQSIVAHEVQDNRYNRYDVYFYRDRIVTTVTSDPDMVTHWITEVEDVILRDVVGLDIEWRPSFIRGHQQNPVATLQICVGSSCLIFQLLHCRSIPQSLVTFLDSYTFVGVGIEGDVEKLKRDHGLRVSYSVDLRELAATAYEAYGMGDQIRRTAGLKELCTVVLGKEIVKPRRVTTSRWDNQLLKEEQVQYACLDAFVSFEIEKRLNFAGYGCNWL